MALLRRSDESTEVDDTLPEAQEFYGEEPQSERTGLAWLLALVSLVVTVVLAVGLFFGGRWSYRKIAGKNNGSKATVSTAAAKTDVSTTTKSSNTNAQAPATTSTKTAPQATNTPQTSTVATNSTPTPKPITNVSTTTPQVAATTTTTNVPTASTPAPTTTSTTSLTNTGPADTVKMFLFVSVIASMAHATYTRKRLATKN